MQRDAEALTEQWHASSDEVGARKQEVEKLQAAVGPAQALAAAARSDEESYRKQVDVVTMATFESGNLDQLDALLAARSPQDFLDQMSALETISSEYRTVLTTLITKVGEADRAQADAAAAVARAQAAVAEAASAEQQLGERKRDADARIATAEHLLRALSPSERRDRNGPTVSAPAITGTGIGVAALRAAASQLGKPYRWGAEGPGSYDCSGLTSWAFARAGVTLPRSSSQQALVGTPVSWNEMQPGDLVFYYSPRQPRRHLRGRRQVHQRARSPATSCATRTSPARPSPAPAASSPRQATSAPQRFGGRSRVVGRRPRHGGRYGGR